MIAVIDYGMGNVNSVKNACEYLGFKTSVTADKKVIQDSSHIILPGVGAFKDAMANLKKRNLIEVLEDAVFEKQTPILGICLGMQLMCEESEEFGIHTGLRWIKARVKKFHFPDQKLPIPHVGWDDITVVQKKPLFSGLSREEHSFYFVHSYYVECEHKSDIAADCHYGILFTAAFSKGNIFGTQFHPEKSQENGMQVLKNFLQNER